MGPSKHLLVQSQQQKPYKKVLNMPKVKNKYIEGRSGVFTVNFELFLLLT